VNTKIALIIMSLFSLYQIKDNYELSNELKSDKLIADSLENEILINDSIIINLKSEYLVALNQVNKDSVNVENFKKNKPVKMKGLTKNEINTKFDIYFNSKRSK